MTETESQTPELEYRILTLDSAGYECESHWGRTTDVEHATEAVKLLNELADEHHSGLSYRLDTVAK